MTFFLSPSFSLMDQLDCHLVSPLLSANAEMMRREKELVCLLAKKDKEIQDYQDQGTTVSRSEWC